MDAQRVPQLLMDLGNWCIEKGFDIDQRLCLGEDDYGGLGIFSQESEIPANTSVVKIPKAAVLSVRNCRISGSIEPVSVGLEAQLNLSLALYSELLLGEVSSWHGYLQSLPQKVDLPLFWEVCASSQGAGGVGVAAEDHDRITAMQWLNGTEVRKILRHQGESGKTLIEELEWVYCTTAEPLLAALDNTAPVTFDGFLRAYSLVSSRAFLVDAYHGLSMVPIADVFNHVQENHVHIESDFHVCLECGSLDQCSHDEAQENREATLAKSEGAPTGCYEMVADDVIHPDGEVFNTYGETLSNAELLTRYGFVLGANDNDRVTWSFEEIYRIYGVGTIAQADIRTMFASLMENAGFMNSAEDSQVLCVHEKTDLLVTGPARERLLFIDSDGSASVGLWVVLMLIAGHQLGLPFDMGELTQLKQLLEMLDVIASITGGEPQHFPQMASMFFDQTDPRHMSSMGRQGELLVQLCSLRLENTGKHGVDDAEIDGLVDTLDDPKSRTKQALLVVLSERSLIQSCQAFWQDFLGFMKPFLSLRCSTA